MNKQITIREYHSSDKAKLISILKLNVPQYFAESEVNDFEDYLEHEIEKYFVVEMDGKLIGAGGINFENNQQLAKISWDFIHPNFHGNGAGKVLLQHRLNILKSMGSIETISVRTSQLAYIFYEKNGFILQEIVSDYWAPGFDLYRMVYLKP